MADSPATGNVDRSLSQSVVDSSTTEADATKTQEKTTSATSADTHTNGSKDAKVEGNADAKCGEGYRTTTATVGEGQVNCGDVEGGGGGEGVEHVG